MKSVKTLSLKKIIFVALFALCLSARAQQPITSIVTNNITAPAVSHSAVKGAGLRSITSLLISSWDSLLTSYTVNYNAPSAANILRLSQFSVSSFSSSVITMPVSAFVKIRRASNPDVGDARDYFNFWSRYSSSPSFLSLNGTFNFTAPEVTDPATALMSNNLSSGYDNIFQNTIANPHFGNIERIDYIVPSGLRCTNDTDRMQSGIAIIDRGTGDPFKIAAITAVDATNTPTAFGNLVSVSAANFGGNLLSSNINYSIMINDSKYYSQGRPSAQASQNLRGVYISLADLGLVNGQRFYGYALFGSDVVTANPDWTTYPTNTNSGSQLDPVNVMGFFKTAYSVLPLPITFSATKVNQSAKLSFTLYNEFNGEYLTVQRSADGNKFEDLDKLQISATGVYSFTDNSPYAGTNYYRLKMVDHGISSNSETRVLKFEEKAEISLFPNPTTEQLNINFPTAWTQESITAEIFNSSGQLVKRMQYERPGIRQTIMVSSLQPGSYMIRLVKKKDYSSCQQKFTIM
jgi:hypothetical protein